MKKIKIVLASGSPRRKNLLEEAGFTVEVVSNQVEENFPDHLPLDEVAPFLALKKAKEYPNPIPKNTFFLTADSTVLWNGQLLGKPVNKAMAVAYLNDLSNQTHTVITGVCIMKNQQHKILKAATSVTFGSLSAGEINFYLDQYRPFDKAGSYGLQEWIGLCKVEKIEGTYSNVMGLPIYEVYHTIMNWVD
jgi:septum formation protein